MRTTTTRLAAVLAAGVLALSACGSDEEPTEGETPAAGEDGGGATDTGDDGTQSEDAGSGDAPAAEGDITIGIKYDQPGLGLMEGDTPSGFDVDVAKAVAAELGYTEEQIVWEEAPTPQREDLLVNGTVDMIFATYSITDERKERVQFAGPYLIAGQDLLVAADSDITGPEDATNAIVCSVTGSTPAERIESEYGITPQNYDTYSLCIEGLGSGVVDAVTTDDTILAGYAAEDQYAGQFKVVGAPFSEELYGVGLPKESDIDCEEVNTILTGLYDDGTMDEIIEANFGPAGYTPSATPEVGGSCG